MPIGPITMKSAVVTAVEFAEAIEKYTDVYPGVL
jgi:hypothetical protein